MQKQTRERESIREAERMRTYTYETENDEVSEVQRVRVCDCEHVT